jgi:predicted O-linked N-acetylglucosamine transferase (SPINDLY family)
VARVYEQAREFHRAGLTERADQLYRQVLDREPGHVPALRAWGYLHCATGKVSRGAELFARSLEIDPESWELRADLAQALTQLQRPAEALAVLDETTPAARGASFWKLRATCLAASQRPAEALECLDKALTLATQDPEVLADRGVLLAQMGRHAEALEACDEALRVQPDAALTWFNRGCQQLALGRQAEAIASFDRAIAQGAAFPAVWFNRGNALQQLERHSEAVATYDLLLAEHPTFGPAWCNRGVSLAALRAFDSSIASYGRAIGCAGERPEEAAEAWLNSGNVLQELLRFEEALQAYAHAAMWQETAARALKHRADLLYKLGLAEEALRDFDTLLEIDPGHRDALGGRMLAALCCCDWSGYAEQLDRIERATRSGLRATSAFVLLATLDAPELQRQSALTWIAEEAPPVAQPLWTGVPHRNHSRIRVAYVSGDFREHPVAHIMAELLEQHDRERFEVYAVSIGPDVSQAPVRKRIEQGAEHFIDAAPWSDADVARRLRDLDIDLAIDVMGPTLGCRPGIFARRPAPVQVAYLGYAGTTGAPYIDYLIADGEVVPRDAHAAYCEQIAELPSPFFASTRRVSAARRSRAGEGLPDAGFVFCCFNASFKLNPDVFSVWMQLLREVDGSVLWLSGASDIVVRNLHREASTRGVSPDRLVFAARVSAPEDHLARLRLADLFLDTYPYNAHSTAADALAAGVPIVTCRGRSFASRVCASLLRASGVTDLVTDSLAAYYDLGHALATDPHRLQLLRARLERGRPTSPLFDAGRCCRHLESAYAAMCERAGRGLAPQSLLIPAT